MIEVEPYDKHDANQKCPMLGIVIVIVHTEVARL